MNSTQPDLRRWTRYPIDVQVRFSVLRDDGVTTTSTARGTNISEGGMALIVNEEIRVGRRVRIAITLPGHAHPIRALATIKNRKGTSYGIEFESMEDADRELLVRACSKSMGGINAT